MYIVPRSQRADSRAGRLERQRAALGVGGGGEPFRAAGGDGAGGGE